jgi:acetyltransferase-like isoleucine patch superfamily enzyme
MESRISEEANIGKKVRIGHGTIIYDNVTIRDNSTIGPYCTIGEPTAAYYESGEGHEFKETVIGENAIIRSHTIIYEDVMIGESFQTGHHAIIREESRIGNHSSFGSFSELPGKATIGNYVRIHSKVMLSECNIIGDYVWIYPFVVLTNVRHPPVGRFQTTVLKEYSQIHSHATILPGITIGKDSIVGAGSLVTKDVPDGRLVIGNPGKDVKSVEDIKGESRGRGVVVRLESNSNDRAHFMRDASR